MIAGTLQLIGLATVAKYAYEKSPRVRKEVRKLTKKAQKYLMSGDDEE